VPGAIERTGLFFVPAIPGDQPPLSPSEARGLDGALEVDLAFAYLEGIRPMYVEL